MKKFATLAAFALHLTIAAVLYATTTNPEYSAQPQDILLKAAAFPDATLAIYEIGAECVISGKYYRIEGDGQETLPFQVECVEGPTGNFVIIGEGWARCRIEGKEHHFLTSK